MLLNNIHKKKSTTTWIYSFQYDFRFVDKYLILYIK